MRIRKGRRKLMGERMPFCRFMDFFMNELKRTA